MKRSDLSPALFRAVNNGPNLLIVVSGPQDKGGFLRGKLTAVNNGVRNNSGSKTIRQSGPPKGIQGKGKKRKAHAEWRGLGERERAA
jgi:hypothetical protein